MSAQVMNTCDSLGLEAFGRDLNVLWTGKDLLTVYFRLPRMLFKQAAFLKKAKAVSGQCCKTCETASCVGNIASSVSYVRDGLAFIANNAAQIRALAPFRPFLRSAVAEWDDFAEDCAIASDLEIRDMICKIADAM